MNDLIDFIDSELKSVADPLKAREMKAYMKDIAPFYGVPAPIRKSISQGLWSEFSSKIKPNWRELCVDLWLKEERECQYIAQDLMQKFKSKLIVEDIELIERLITTKSWWDTVDFLAANIVGSYFLKFPDNKTIYIDRWSTSDNIWLVRSSIIFQLKYKEKTDFNLIKKIILSYTESKEFFINKAGGWALRQHSKLFPEEVHKFLDENEDLPNLVVREASKYL